MKKSIEKNLNLFLKSAAMLLVRSYQLMLSPFLGGNCRFEPSCSQYAISVLQGQSPLNAIRLIAKRILKCHPLGGQGYDPAPEPSIIRERSFNS